MTNRPLGEGHDVSYDDLVGELQEGEVLVATWLRSPGQTPKVLVTDEHGFASITDKGTRHHYLSMRWFASTTGSTNYSDYNA